MLLLKLVLAPTLIGAATLAARRWGPGIGGWLVALPLTSGPVALFLALDHGQSFAVASAIGSIGGAAAEAGFCLAYAVVGQRTSWPVALSAGSLGYVLASIAIQPVLLLPLAGELAIVVAVLALSLRAIPPAVTRTVGIAAPRWDLPARMVAGTDRKSTRLNSSHSDRSRMPSSA